VPKTHKSAPEQLPEALHDCEQAMPGLARWMYRSVHQYLGQNVLDAGAGIGTFVSHLRDDGKTVTAIEFLPELVEDLRARFNGDDQVSIRQGDLSDLAAFQNLGAFDSVLCLNVLEHIEDDVAAMRNMLEVTSAGGRLVALVPAYSWLFNRMDRAVGHHRRYGRGELVQKLRLSGWSVERCTRFNAVAIAGWFLAGSVLRRDRPGQDLARIYDALIPGLAFLENHILRRSVGLSLIAVCRRPDQGSIKN
jgi:SAM-dependent methyltransferase